jgi:uncharacterized protein (DUF58 family)
MSASVMPQRTHLGNTGKPSGFVVSDLMMVLLVALATVGVLQDRVVLATLGALVLVIALLSRVWARQSLRDVSYHCETSSTRALEGDELLLTLTLENRKAVPVPWVLVREQIPAGLQLLDGQAPAAGLFRTSLLVTTTAIGAQQRVRLRFRIKALRRGHYVLGPGRLTSGDPFGFYESEHVIVRATHTLIVYPAMSPLPDGGIKFAHPIGEARARVRSMDDPTLPLAVREYMPGDSMRAIDWKVTARRGAPWVRVNASSVAGAVLLVLECDTRVQGVWDDSPQLLERIVHTAASLARDLLLQGHAVGLIANGVPPGDHARVALAPAAGREQLNAVLDALARVQNIIVKPLSLLLREHGARAMPFGSTVVGISAVPNDAMTLLLTERRAQGLNVVHIYVGDESPAFDSSGAPVVEQLHWPRLDVFASDAQSTP